MSNTIAHLVVARKIIECNPDLVQNPDAFYLGTLAPDTISSKPGCTREDKKRVHLRQDIRDVQWLEPEMMALFNGRVHRFVEEHILITSLSREQRDFNMGYLVHLLTDKWNHKTIRQTMLRIAQAKGIQESDRAFFHMMTNDLEALDLFLLSNDPELLNLFSYLSSAPIHSNLPGYIEANYIEGSFCWWKEQYLPGIQDRKLLYVSEEDIEDFVSISSREIIKELSLLL